MNAPAAQQTLFKDLVADLPDQHQAEFFRNLHEAGISPNDVELARLLRALQLYKAYYESIPAAVRAAAAEIERLKEDDLTASVPTRVRVRRQAGAWPVRSSGKRNASTGTSRGSASASRPPHTARPRTWPRAWPSC